MPISTAFPSFSSSLSISSKSTACESLRRFPSSKRTSIPGDLSCRSESGIRTLLPAVLLVIRGVATERSLCALEDCAFPDRPPIEFPKVFCGLKPPNVEPWENQYGHSSQYQAFDDVVILTMASGRCRLVGGTIEMAPGSFLCCSISSRAFVVTDTGLT